MLSLTRIGRLPSVNSQHRLTGGNWSRMYPLHGIMRYGEASHFRTFLSTRKLGFASINPPIDVVLWTTVPVAPNLSAAGVRTRLLLEALAQERNSSSQHSYLNLRSLSLVVPPSPDSSMAKPSVSPEVESIRQTHKTLEEEGIRIETVAPNRSEEMQELLERLLVPSTSNVSDIAEEHPRLLCIFDRFFTEEMYSHAIRKHCVAKGTWDQTMFLLDMQDMHSLRKSRETAVQAFFKKQPQKEEQDELGLACYEALQALPDSQNTMLLRELASIHRCDLTWVCSPTETSILKDKYGIPPSKLETAPLLESGSSQETKGVLAGNTFHERKDLCFVGGFHHAPNVDAVHQLIRLWPRLRRKLTQQLGKLTRETNIVPPRLLIYGAHCTSHLQNQWKETLTAQKDSINEDWKSIEFVGFVPGSISEVLKRHRLMLVPLRFGAGLKGKIVEAWQMGTPTVTTSIGAEGLWPYAGVPFPGRVADSDATFLQAVMDLYTREDVWQEAQAILNESDLAPWREDLGLGVWPALAIKVGQKIADVPSCRSSDYTQSILWHQSNRSTEFFSKYIEYKELNPPVTKR